MQTIWKFMGYLISHLIFVFYTKTSKTKEDKNSIALNFFHAIKQGKEAKSIGNIAQVTI